MTWNSVPSMAPLLAKRCAEIEPASVLLPKNRKGLFSQTVTKSPLLEWQMAGESCDPEV